MQTTSPAMEAQSVLEPDGSHVEPDTLIAEPDVAALDDPADDSDLRTLDVTAGEPD